MAMQHTPLLMSNILDRGAKVAPNEEIVTLTENGVRRQTIRKPGSVPSACSRPGGYNLK